MLGWQRLMVGIENSLAASRGDKLGHPHDGSRHLLRHGDARRAHFRRADLGTDADDVLGRGLSDRLGVGGINRSALIDERERRRRHPASDTSTREHAVRDDRDEIDNGAERASDKAMSDLVRGNFSIVFRRARRLDGRIVR